MVLSVSISTAFILDLLHLELRKVTLVPNPIASREGSFTVVSGLAPNLGGAETRGWTSALIRALHLGDADQPFQHLNFPVILP